MLLTGILSIDIIPVLPCTQNSRNYFINNYFTKSTLVPGLVMTR